MMRSIFWLLLAGSLLFNVFFAVGYIQARAEAARASANGTADGTTRQVAAELQLDAGQAAVYSDLRTTLHAVSRTYNEQIALVRHELAAELERPEPDADRLRELVGRTAELEQARTAARAERFKEFIGVLSPKQCRKLGRKVGSEHRRREMHKRLLERFDENGNGTLEGAEREKAREFMERRRAEQERRWEEMKRRFDANGNGRLDDDERAALHEWRKQHGDRRGGPPNGHRGRRGSRSETPEPDDAGDA